MRYELWVYEQDDIVEWALMPVDHQYGAFLKYKEIYEPSSEMAWGVEAENRDEALARYRELVGHEPDEPAGHE